MLTPVSADGWSAIDNWWGSFKQDQSLILAPSYIRKMPNVAGNRHWSNVDSLWNVFEADHGLLFAEQHVQALSDDPEVDAWASVDDLWDAEQQDDLLKLQELRADLREVWNNGASQFDEDPLTTDWRSESQYEGPLRTTANEEAWSHWLAHLLRMSSGPFAHELLGTPERPPVSVRTEVEFSNDNSTNRVDILVEYEDLGVSIEVKQGDPDYEKTRDAAGLVELNDPRDWSHVLLLQKYKLPRLQQTFGDDLNQSEEGPPTIRSNQSADIDVWYWRDISRVLRRMLIKGREADSHWEASAYLFITLIEQRVLKLYSFSFVEPATVGNSDTIPASDIHRLVITEPDEQIDYLRAVLQQDQKHE